MYYSNESATWKAVGGFVSLAELKDWVSDKAVPTCGVYWDLFSIMVTMGPGQLSGQVRADKEYSSSRTKTTVLENDLLAAIMTHEKPSCLYGNGGGALLTKKEACQSDRSSTKYHSPPTEASRHDA
jgi:hypothetical protein